MLLSNILISPIVLDTTAKPCSNTYEQDEIPNFIKLTYNAVKKKDIKDNKKGTTKRTWTRTMR